MREEARLAVPAEVRAAMGADPTEEQWRAISMGLEPYVVVAGAGSGKTSVMAARVVYLALVALGRAPGTHAGVLPGNVLCLTFTNKATEILVARIRRALSTLDLPEGEEPTILNYHGFAAQVLDRHGLRAGIEPGQRILSPAQRTELCARVLDELSFRYVRAEWQPSLIDNILTLADQAADHRVEPDAIVAFNEARLEALAMHRSDRAYRAAQERIELARAVKRFQEMKRDLGVIDFGDQITLALGVAERYPEVGQDYRERYQAVVLDEYQDTNVAQADLIGTLFGDGFPVTAVGDPDQNIYAWRGASLYNLLDFPSRFASPDGTRAPKLPLYTNFRSGARILEAADTIIGPLPAKQRPDPDKQLAPWPANGTGHVELVKLADEWAEAQWIADRIEALHREDPKGRPWSSFAVLCRKSRLFAPLQEALGERSVPAEFVGLTGLLNVPEVVEVLAYARAVADPHASVSLARILLGPRYRVGFKDLARVGAWAKNKNYLLRDEDADEETPQFVFSEAVEHLEEIEHLSDDGRHRLEAFRDELTALRVEARRPVGDFLAEVIRRIGLLAELEASLDAERVRTARRNLAAFLDEVHAFSPLEGELTLRAFLDYVLAVQASDKPEWSPVQPGEDDSVKVMTIHQAKGLEFDTVFVPGLARGLLPDPAIQHNPAERGKSLDFELRGDRDILPSYQGVLKQFADDLRDQEIYEERRTLYVALTRARQRLFVTGAHWYGEDVRFPKDPSLFFGELADWGTAAGTAVVDRGPECPEENPLSGYRQRFLRDWPGPPRPEEADHLFPSGWRRAAARASAEGRVPIDGLAPEEHEEYRKAAEELRMLAGHLVERERELPRRPAAPATVSVSGVIDYARCPKLYYWSAVRPLPRFSGPAARIGSQVHGWIERRSSGQTSLVDMDEPPDLSVEELAGEPGKIERLQEAFLRSRFAKTIPLFAERAFLLHLDGFVIQGRIDAIYVRPDGGWEVVDYKTGRVPPESDELSGLQLDLYALACGDVWGKAPSELVLTYFYLGSGQEVSRPAGDPAETRARVLAALRAMTEAEFDPKPGDACWYCDFRSFCEPGQRFVAEQASREGGP